MKHLWLPVAILSALLLRAAYAQAPVTVAIVDTGINDAHEHFNGVPMQFYDATEGLSGQGTFDTCLHGTSMAGLVVDQNPDVELLIIQASWFCQMRQDHVTNGINYAVEHGANIISITSNSTYDYPPMRQAISDAVASGVLVVISAGNTGDDTPQYPAAYTPALTVAAYDWKQSSYGAWVDLAAPSKARVPIASDGYINASGTSVSAAIVAGQAARIWAQQPGLTLDELIALLYSTLVDIDPPGYDAYTGHGRLDVRRLDEALGIHYLSVPWVRR